SKDLQPRARRGDERQGSQIAAAFTAGRSGVVGNVNATAATPAPPIRPRRQHGAPIVGCYFPSAGEGGGARHRPRARGRRRANRQRSGAERVPDVAIYAAAKRLEPPSLAEGFDELRVVRLRPDGGFDVTEEVHPGA